MANGYIPAAVERGCDPCSQVKVENKAYLGGVLGIDVNGERQPINDGGIVDLTFIETDIESAAQRAEQAANESQTAQQAAENASAAAYGSQLAAHTAATAAEIAQGAAETAKTAAQVARAGAETARAGAEAAKTAAQTAQTGAQTAQTAAESAATDAAGSASDASASATASAGSASQAAASATNAASSATAASGSATQAAGSATAANTSAQAAATLVEVATQAAADAETAQAGAEAAQSEAEAVEARIMDTVPDAVADWLDEHITQETGYVIDDSLTVQGAAADAKAVGDALIDKAPIITDTASGAIASFPDGTDAPIKQLTVSIEPKQDLHGYDAPWPVGGGKNLLPTSVAGIKSANAAGTWSGNEYTYNGVKYTIITDQDGNVTGINANGTASADSDIYLVQGYTFPAGSYTLNGCPSGGSSSTYRIFATNWGGDTGSGATVTLNGLTPTNMRVQIKSGTTANNLLFKPMVRLASVTDGTFAPYSNICPITGWTGANVARAGKNLLSMKAYAGGGYNPEIGTVWNLTLNGTQPSNPSRGVYQVTFAGSWYGLTLICPVMAGKKYRIFYSGNSTGNCGRSYGLLDKNFTVLTKANDTDTTFTYDTTWDIPANGAYFYLFITNRSSAGATITINNPQIELGETKTDYEPYAGTSYPITWQSEAGTVYGGTLTVEEDGTGTLVADTVTFNLAEQAWTYYSTAGLNTFNCSLYYANYDNPLAQCDRYAFNPTIHSIASQSNGSMIYYKSGSGNVRLSICDNRFTSAADFVASLTGAEFVYRHKESVTYTLTAAEMTTLFGQNNWWADCGDIAEIEYRADTKLYIDKKLAALLAALS